MWTVLGSLSVLVVGFAVLWWTGLGASAGPPVAATPPPLAPAAAVTVARIAEPIPAAPAGNIQVQQLDQPFAPDPVMLPVRVSRAESRRFRYRRRMAAAIAAATGAALKADGATPAPEATAAPARPAPDKAASPADQAAAKESAAAAASPLAEADEAPAREAAPPPPVREKRTAAEMAVMGDADDDARPREPQPREVVEAALKALTPRVRRCFFKFQIPGNAQVKLVATPQGGEAETVTVSGEFEGTPTGECVMSAVAGATLPAFKGEALRLSHVYVLR
jgi:hypothetical protein